MAQFKDVFSTTAKVIAAVFIVSAIIGVGFLFWGGVVSFVASSSSSAPVEKNHYEEDADARRTTMPLSKWNRGIKLAAKNQCVTDGMNEDEVASAVGQPSSKSPSSWRWKLAPGKCLKYQGDTCAESEQNEAIILFTSKGNVYLHSANCETLSSKQPIDEGALFK